MFWVEYLGVCEPFAIDDGGDVPVWFPEEWTVSDFSHGMRPKRGL